MDPLLVAQGLGVAFPLFFSGMATVLSQATFPLLYDLAPTSSLSKFANLYHEKGQLPKAIVGLATVTNGFLAYSIPMHRTSYIFAAIFSFSTIPITLVVMMPGVRKLLKLAETPQRIQITKAEEVVSLIKACANQNWLRVSASAAGAIFALVPLLQH